MIAKLQSLIKYPRQLKFIIIESFLLSLKNEVFLKFGIYKPIKHLHFNDPNNSLDQSIEKDLPLLKFAAKSSKLLEKYAPWRPRCYNRALTIKQLLKKRNIDTQLHIGFRKKDGAFDGHAWITYQDKVVTGNLPKLHTFSEFNFAKAEIKNRD